MNTKTTRLTFCALAATFVFGGVAAADTYPATGASQPIQDLQTASMTVMVPDVFTISDLNVVLEIDHPDTADLDIVLRHPDGTSIVLLDDVAGGFGFDHTILDEDAFFYILDFPGSPFRGNYQPEGFLDTFHGLPGHGTWTLEVFDDEAGNEGTLVRFALAFNGETKLALSGQVPAAIDSSNPTTVSTLFIYTAGESIADVEVVVEISHEQLADLDVVLRHPDGTAVELFTDIGGRAGQMDWCALDDQAAANVAGGASPFTGRFSTESGSAFAALLGKPADGTWKLELTDDAAGNAGTLADWWIHVTPSPLPPANDDCANARVIGLGTTVGTTVNSTLDPPTSCDAGGVYGPGVFYSFTAPGHGTLNVTTCGTNDFPGINAGIDTVVTLFDACGGNEIDCDDDEFVECGDISFVGDSFASTVVMPGDTIIIEVSSFGSTPTGLFFLNVFYDGSPFTDSCNGDGGDQMGCTDCPCGNDAAPGTIGGCLNSAGTSGRLLASGSTSIFLSDLRFEASGIAPLNSCVLVSGNALAPQNPANPCFGQDSGVQSMSLDGLRCVVGGGGAVLRHGVRPSDANGDVGLTTSGWGDPNGFFQFSAFVVGDTKHFQIFHRDAGSCGTGQNTTQAVSLTFTF